MMVCQRSFPGRSWWVLFDRWAGLWYDGRRWLTILCVVERRQTLRLLISWFINAVALAVAVWLLEGIDVTGDNAWFTLTLVALIFGLINALIRPLVKLLTCLINVLTLGLFTLVINAAMLMLTSWIAQQLELGFEVQDFWWALLGAIITSVVSIVLNAVLKRDD